MDVSLRSHEQRRVVQNIDLQSRWTLSGLAFMSHVSENDPDDVGRQFHIFDIPWF